MKLGVFCSVFFLVTFSICGQDELQITAKDSIVQSAWMVGVGFNAVDDAGNNFEDLFNFQDNWNIVPFPSRVSLGRYFKNGLGIEAIGSYNIYKEGKLIDGVINTADVDYYAIDSRFTYDLNKIVGQTAWFDPYVGVGAGYTNASNKGRGTYNAVIGFRTWFSNRWGLDFSSTAKWAMKKGNGVTNHLQHAAGVVYQFGIQKGLSKQGQDKLALLEAIAAEKQRQNDSIAEVNRLRDEKLLAERLERERAEAALAAAEKAKRDAQLAKENAIKAKIDELGFVYFDLNSSFLNAPSKKVLDKLVQFLEEMPTLQLKITSHTDSRGSSKYNDWLSQRRVDRTEAYLVAKGVPSERLTKEAYGEQMLLNECDDTVYCPESKHSVNRRSEFIITKF